MSEKKGIIVAVNDRRDDDDDDDDDDDSDSGGMNDMIFRSTNIYYNQHHDISTVRTFDAFT